MPQVAHSHLGRSPAGLLIRIDPRVRAGLQHQIYTTIRRAILDGVVAPGTQLASSRPLADDLRASRTTTLLAHEQLTAEGYVTARDGSGTFVAQVLPDDLSRVSAPRRVTRTKHPPLSRRGEALAAPSAPPRRLPGPSRAFRLGAPARDLFPHRRWSELARRRLRPDSAQQRQCKRP